ncbi:MAG: hypothetical protein K6E73_09555 [Bacteroidales bacterium]|nr:hypothetical protein [Bacteroidales bacterium]
MAKFAQYYLEYLRDDMFAEIDWTERQKHFGSYFENDESVHFTSDDGGKTYKHNVYHLSSNRDIIVMRIANDTTKDVIQNFRSVSVKHEPPCFVIIDNRDRCRRVAIQRSKNAFSTTEMLKNILLNELNKRMKSEHNIGIALHPQYYPRDFYKAWRLHQYETSSLRFNLSEHGLPADFDRTEYEDASIMDFAIAINEEETRKKYKTAVELSAPEGVPFLLVDEDSSFIRNLVKFHAATGSSIELVTKDGASFTCFIDDDEESDCIITKEIEAEYLQAFFPESGDFENEDVRKAIVEAERKLVEFVNSMKLESDEIKGVEKVA